MNKPSIERKRIFVNSLIQGQLLWKAAMYWVVYHIVMWHTLFLFTYFQYRIELFNGGEASTLSALYGTFCLKYYSIVFAALSILPILMIDMVRYTHRVAGPLINFQNALKRMKAGEKVEVIKLRKNDLLVEFQDEFNSFLEYYNNNQNKEVEITEEQLLADVTELKKSVGEELIDTCEMELNKPGS